MITMDLREAIQLQSVYGPSTGAYQLVADIGKARDSVLQFLTAPLPHAVTRERFDVEWIAGVGYCGPQWPAAETARRREGR